jgi:hypothetical protein
MPSSNGPKKLTQLLQATVLANTDLILVSQNTATIPISTALPIGLLIQTVAGAVEQEPVSYVANTSGVVPLNCNGASYFSLSQLTGNITPSFYNFSMANSTMTSLTVYINQGNTAYIPGNTVQINGAVANVNWAGNGSIVGTPTNVDVVEYTVLNNSGNYQVLGQLQTYV